jgi:hypothetical protein
MNYIVSEMDKEGQLKQPLKDTKQPLYTEEKSKMIMKTTVHFSQCRRRGACIMNIKQYCSGNRIPQSNLVYIFPS